MSKIMIFSGYTAVKKSPLNREKTMKRGKAQKKLAKYARECSKQIKRTGGSFPACIKKKFRHGR